MSEVVVSKKSSFVISSACLLLGTYCVQFGLFDGGFKSVGLYIPSLLLLIFLVVANSKGVRFTGLDVVPPNKIVVVTFWGTLFVLLAGFILGIGSDAYTDKSRPSHFFVGLWLLIFFGLTFFGSFFSGFGTYLFLRNPISWVRNVKNENP